MTNREKNTAAIVGGFLAMILLGVVVYFGVQYNEWSKKQAIIDGQRQETLAMVAKVARRLSGDVDDNTHSLRRPVDKEIDFVLPDKDVWGHNLTATYGKHLTQETVDVRSFGQNGLEGDTDDITVTESQWNFGGATAVGGETIRKFTASGIKGTADGLGDAAESVGGRFKRWWSSEKPKEAPRPKGEARQ